MSPYLSSPNDSRNNRGSRYQETFFLFPIFSPPPLAPRRHVNPRRAHDRRALRHIFYRGTHSGCYRRVLPAQPRPICIRNFSLSRLDTAGVVGKIQVRGAIGRHALETSAPGYTQRETTFVATFPAGQILFRARRGPLSRILLSPHIFRYER